VPTTLVAKRNLRIQHQKNFVALNIKQQKYNFSRIKLNCEEGMKMYVDGGRVIIIVSI
jgi:hypothetical protein